METETKTNTEPEASSDEQQKVIELIKKCLALADSPYEHEATVAMAKAQELLQKYNLSMKEVSIKDVSSREMFEGKIGYNADWKQRLYVHLARENFCSVLVDINKKHVIVLGRVPNILATYEMGQWLAQQIERIVREEMIDYNQYPIINGRVIQLDSPGVYKKNFALGMVIRIIARLQELNRDRRETIPNMSALTLDLRKEADDFKKKVYPYTSLTTMAKSSGPGYTNGLKAGDSISVVVPSKHIEETRGFYLS